MELYCTDELLCGVFMIQVKQYQSLHSTFDTYDHVSWMPQVISYPRPRPRPRPCPRPRPYHPLNKINSKVRIILCIIRYSFVIREYTRIWCSMCIENTMSFPFCNWSISGNDFSVISTLNPCFFIPEYCYYCSGCSMQILWRSGDYLNFHWW